jgi:DNA gyrase subunit A
LYLFVADGRCVSLPVYQLPQAREMGKGTHWAELTSLSRRDHVVAALVRPSALEEGYLTLSTIAGVVKRVRLEDLPGITSDPFTVIGVAEDDSLGWARLTSGEEQIVLATAAGQLIRFQEETVRPMGLPAGGVMGIKLANDADGVIAMDIAQSDTYVWSITDNGLAKATAIDEYPTQGRYGQGVINLRLPKDAAEVVAVVIGPEKMELLITTAIGSTKKLILGKTQLGSRAIKPRSVLKIGDRNRITGAVRLTTRPDWSEDEDVATAVPQQLSFIDQPETKKSSRKAKR